MWCRRRGWRKRLAGQSTIYTGLQNKRPGSCLAIDKAKSSYQKVDVAHRLFQSQCRLKLNKWTTKRPYSHFNVSSIPWRKLSSPKNCKTRPHDVSTLKPMSQVYLSPMQGFFCVILLWRRESFVRKFRAKRREMSWLVEKTLGTILLCNAEALHNVTSPIISICQTGCRLSPHPIWIPRVWCHNKTT